LLQVRVEDRRIDGLRGNSEHSMMLCCRLAPPNKMILGTPDKMVAIADISDPLNFTLPGAFGIGARRIGRTLLPTSHKCHRRAADL